jgi:excisionase family DNA binding protein
MTEFMSVHDIAELFHVNEFTVRRHIRNGDLPAIKVGGRVRVRRADVEAFMKPIVPAQTLIIKPVTADDIARRRAIAAHLDSLRAQMKPLGMTTAELIRLARHEEEMKYDHL